MWLVCTGATGGNLPVRLMSGTYVVGRSGQADIIIRDAALSRRHAELVCGHDSVVVRDLGSRNGTFVNERPADATVAELGSRIRFGTVVCLLSSVPILPAESSERASTMGVSGGGDKLEGLTPAQREVLSWLLRGHDEVRIAQRLRRSTHTIHTHLKAIYRHFHVHSRPELIARLLRQKR